MVQICGFEPRTATVHSSLQAQFESARQRRYRLDFNGLSHVYYCGDYPQ